MRKFTKYPSNYVKASTGTNPYMKDLSEYLDYLSDDEINSFKIETGGGFEPCFWIEIPSHLRSVVENAVGTQYCSVGEPYFYYIEYHPDDDSIYFGVDTDVNLEPLKVSKETEDRFKQKFREFIGVTASTPIKADTEGISLEQAIRNAKSAAKRDGYPQFVFIDSTGGYAIDRYYGQNPDWDTKELVRFIDPDGHIMKGVTFDDFGSQELDDRIWPLAKGYFN